MKAAASHVFRRVSRFSGATVWLNLALLFLATMGCNRQQTSSPPSEMQSQAGILQTNRPHPALEKLVGKWQRPDGGYVLEIRSVASDGKLEAGYFNPKPINVSLARAIRDDETVTAFVELRDVSYPGCTYKLKYDPATDQLFGEYYQAAMGQTFDITFGRLKD